MLYYKPPLAELSSIQVSAGGPFWNPHHILYWSHSLNVIFLITLHCIQTHLAAECGIYCTMLGDLEVGLWRYY